MVWRICQYAKLHIFADIQRIPLKFRASLLLILNHKNIYQLLKYG